MTKTINVLFIASEAAPLVKIGGLGDVAGTLPKTLRTLYRPDGESGVDIRIALPFYPALKNKVSATHIGKVSIAKKQHQLSAQVYETYLEGTPVYLIDGEPIQQSTQVYTADPSRDAEKFVFFSLACLQLPTLLQWKIDLLHANDWHTAPAIYALFRKRKEDASFTSITSLLTIHNLPYLGNGAQNALDMYNLPPLEDSILPAWAQHLPLPLGLYSADHITTVSPGYAQEILTPEFGSGLEQFLRTRSQNITGILNGIDYKTWNPETDHQIPQNFTVEKLHLRRQNKLYLLDELGLQQQKDTALIGMINRMDFQKGVDLVPQAVEKITNLPWQMVILGTGDPKIEAAARELEARHPDRVKVVLAYNEALARRIYAGTDILLIPSRYEPCGLTQMIAMRYANIPVARRTGGLGDTIRDYQDGFGTGFLFDNPDAVELAVGIQRAVLTYADKRRWKPMQRRCMKQDFSLEKSASQYYQLYRKLVFKKST